jgi:hypothetical protein
MAPLKGGVPYLEPIDVSDAEMLRTQGPKFEILYNKLSNRDRREISSIVWGKMPPTAELNEISSKYQTSK